jgi:hypothetical protein
MAMLSIKGIVFTVLLNYIFVYKMMPTFAAWARLDELANITC